MTRTDAPEHAWPNTPRADAILTALAVGLAAFATLFVVPVIYSLLRQKAPFAVATEDASADAL